MTLLASSELPIIEFTKDAMKPGTTTWDLTRELVRKAVEEYGCFKATFDEINSDLYIAMFSSLMKLMDLPKDTKRRCVSDVSDAEAMKSYVSDLPEIPLYESMQIADALSLPSIRNLVLHMWSQGDDTICETLHSYLTRVSNLERVVREMIFESYGVKKYFKKESESMKYVARLNKYGAPMTDEDTTQLGCHYDNNFITILQGCGLGLQVMGNNGEWDNIGHSDSSLIVIMGESFFGWSNGRVKCCLHRVKMSGCKSRYSIGLFSGKDGTVEIPIELIDEQHPRLFKPFDQPGLLKVIMQQVKDKTYAGEDDTMLPIVATHYAI